MGVVGKSLVALIGCLLVALVAAAMALPLYVESEAFESALRDEMEADSGASIEWERLDASFLSPSVTLERPVLVFRERHGRIEGSEERIRWRSESGRARLALWPLLAGRVEVRDVVLSKGRIEYRDPRPITKLDWTFEDVEFAAPRLGSGRARDFRFSGRLPIGEARALLFSAVGNLTTRADGSFELLVDALEIDERSLGLEGVGALRSTRASNGAFALDASLDLGADGRARVEASRNPAGGIDLLADLEQFDLAIAESFVSDPRFAFGGVANGELRLAGGGDLAERLELELLVTEGRLRLPDYTVEGSIPVVVQIDAPFSKRPSGRFELDLADARLRYREQIEKPAGIRAAMTTRFEVDPDGELELESRFELRDLHQILSLGRDLGIVE